MRSVSADNQKHDETTRNQNHEKRQNTVAGIQKPNTRSAN